jgi:SAM-dependent methyltransferase
MGSPNDLIYIKTVCPTVTGSVLEVGARENSTRFRDYFISNDRPTVTEYIGTDIEPGTDVDVICDLTAPVNPLPKNHFDLVICCSVMEHVPNPWVMAEKISELVKSGGKLYIAVPWVWKYHKYPDDYYRYSFKAIEFLFSKFRWSDYAYSTELPNSIEFVERDSDFDRRRAFVETREDGSIKKYLPYSMINMIGTKND